MSAGHLVLTLVAGAFCAVVRTCGCGHVGRCGMVTACMPCPGQLRSVRIANQGKALLAAQQQGDCVSAGHLVARRSSIRTYVRTTYTLESKLGNTRTS